MLLNRLAELQILQFLSLYYDIRAHFSFLHLRGGCYVDSMTNIIMTMTRTTMMGADNSGSVAKALTVSNLPRGLDACPHSAVLCCSVYVEALRWGEPPSET